MLSLNSLMSGGWEPDYCTDPLSAFDLWVEETEEEAKKMSDDRLLFEIDDARRSNDFALASIYEDVLNKRPKINVPVYSTLADEPYNDEFDDKRKEQLEDLHPDEDELPF